MLRLRHAEDRPPGCIHRHQGRGRAAALRSGAAGGVSGARGARALPGRSTVRQFKGGQSNPTYLLETPARKYVLRRKPPGKLLPSAHAVDREFRVIQRARTRKAFRWPSRCSIAPTRASPARAFYVMGFVEGRVFWNPEMPGSNPRRARGGLRRDERDAGAAAFVRAGGDRAWRFRPRRELRRAPGRPLVEAVPRLARPRRSTRWSG